MAKWRLLSDEEARRCWDDALLNFDDYTPFQSYAWGEYRRSLGWEPCRWAAFNERGDIVAMMSGALRRYPCKVGLIWSEGGPVGDLTNCDGDLQEAMKQTTGLRHLYCRFRCDRERRIEDALQLNAVGWNRSWFNLTSNFSMSIDLKTSDENALSTFGRNWKRNLKHSRQSNLTVRQWLDPNVADVLAVYGSMQAVKGLEEQHSHDEVELLLRHCRSNLVLYRCDDESGQLVSLAGWLVLGNRAWSVISATSEQGRALHASYLTFWELYQHCKRIGLESCDLAGIDPIKNHGVYRFKKDTGARHLEYLGEWDWATSGLLRWGGNWGISRRRWVSMTTQRAMNFVGAAVATLSLGRSSLPRTMQRNTSAGVEPGAIATGYFAVMNTFGDEANSGFAQSLSFLGF
jgi:hypothetical protein